LYDELKMELGFRADIIVENKVILELKSWEVLSPVHSKQLLTYLKLTELKLGLLINFGEALIKNGIHRIVNKL
jgi:GxxExxY protein